RRAILAKRLGHSACGRHALLPVAVPRAGDSWHDDNSPDLPKRGGPPVRTRRQDQPTSETTEEICESTGLPWRPGSAGASPRSPRLDMDRCRAARASPAGGGQTTEAAGIASAAAVQAE